MGYGGRDRASKLSRRGNSAAAERGIYRIHSLPLPATPLKDRWDDPWNGETRYWSNATRMWAGARLVVNGSQPGCEERRRFWYPVCEYDGRLSVASLRGATLIYARANTRQLGNGRHVQVARSPDGKGSWGPFSLVTFACGKLKVERGPSGRKRIPDARNLDYNGIDFGSWAIKDIYYFAVSPNGHDQLTALFPATFTVAGEQGGALQGGVFVAFSSDGVAWSTPVKASQMNTCARMLALPVN